MRDKVIGIVLHPIPILYFTAKLRTVALGVQGRGQCACPMSAHYVTYRSSSGAITDIEEQNCADCRRN